MFSISIKVNASEAKRLFAKIERRTHDYRPVFLLGRKSLEAANASNFALGGLPSGGWAPLSPVTSAWKAENGFPPNPLIRTGRLMDSLSTLRGSPNEINHHSATFGTDVKYAKFHQHGTTRMPARQIVFEPVGFAELMAEAAKRHLLPEAGAALSTLKAAF